MKQLILISFIIFYSCNTQPQDLKTVFSFPENLNEVSGLVYHPKNESIFVLQDKGNGNVIFNFDTLGKQLNQLNIAEIKNTDWEDLTIDVDGNLYIGDFGNNDNKRKDLTIYKIDNNQLNSKTTNPTQITKFSYPEQLKFPPKKNNLIFDCEAFVVIDSSFYLFTKNRSKNFDGTFNVYKVPNKNGTFEAQKIATLNSGNSYKNDAITGAAFDFDSKTIALTTHTKVILIPFKNDASFINENLKQLAYNHFSQKESITFKNHNTLFIADEREKKTDFGGNLYDFKIKNHNSIQK